MRYRLFILLVWLLNAPGPSSAQNPVFKAYTVSNGLGNNAVRRIYQDSTGFLWIPTWEGLSKYDGHKFTNFTTSNGLPHSLVNDVVEMSKGELLVAMNDGSLSVIRDGKVNTLTRKGRIINRFFVDSRKKLLAVADYVGILLINPEKTMTVLPVANNSSFFGVTEFKPGHYLGVGGKYTVRYFDSSYRIISTLIKPNFIPYFIHYDSRQRLWMGTESGLKLLRLDGQKLSWQPLPAKLQETFLSWALVQSVFEDKSGDLWFGSSEGLLQMTPEGKLTVYDERDGLPSRKITSIFRDREDNLWVGTFAGLAKLTHPSIFPVDIPVRDKVANPVYFINRAGAGTFILVTQKALYSCRMKDQVFKTLLPLNSTPVSVQQHTGYSMIYQGRLYDYDSTHGKLVIAESYALPTDLFCAARKDDVIVTGSGYGVKIFIGQNEPVTTLDSLRINNILIDREGIIWVGTWGEGFFRLKLDKENKKIVQVENLSTYINDIAVRSIYEDRSGKIWVGTRYNGITVFGAGNRFSGITHIDQQHGLFSNWVNCFAESSNGNVWAGTLSGINKMIPISGGYRVFNYSRTNNYFAVVNSMVFENDSSFWCYSEKGLYNLADKKYEELPPLPVYLTRVQVGKTDSNFAYHLSEKLKLNYNQNSSGFEFTAPGFINENELLYSYRLMGSGDTAWSEPSNQHSIQYASLKPGNYQFEVRNIGWNGKPGQLTVFPFEISAPFWQRSWFYLLVFCMAAGLLYLFYRYRIRQLVKLQRVRNNIATDLHDDIGSTLTNINILSQLSLSHLHKPEEARQFLAKITDQVQGSSEALDDIIWSVNTRHDSISETLARMRRYAGDLFDNTPINCRVSFAEVAENAKLSMEQRRDLFLIYKEVLNNVRKHSGAENIVISVMNANKEIRLTVEDDGKGFDTSTPTNRNGLKNIQTRASKWNGRVKLDSGRGAGTIVNVFFPLSS